MLAARVGHPFTRRHGIGSVGGLWYGGVRVAVAMAAQGRRDARGTVRAETISGNVTMTDTPRLENAKSVSGDVLLTGVSADGDLPIASRSRNVTAK